jgi:hypothetical protein
MAAKAIGAARITRLELEIALLRRELKRVAKIVQRSERAYRDLIVRSHESVVLPDELEELEDFDLQDDFDRDELGENPEED